MSRSSPIATTLRTFPLCAAAGALSRYALRTAETRWQILAFYALAVGVELTARTGVRDCASVPRGTLNVAAAAAMIGEMNFHLEPDSRQQGSGIVRHAVHEVIDATRSSISGRNATR